ncbi:MAG: membrane protein insertion efficiency factor YidD [Vulcanimicrobiota bacterium]
MTPVNLDNRRFMVFALIVMILLIDISRLPDQQVTNKAALLSIRAYKKFISPGLSTFITCKFEPSCSVYGYQALERYGIFWGGLMAVERLSRCTPWNHSHGWDPVN